MHILGQILAVAVVVAAILASMFTSKVVVVRNSWTAKNVALKNKFLETKPKVDALEDKVDRLKGDLLRSQDLWGKFWNGVQTNVANPNDGSLTVNVGLESGWTQNLLLHGFEIGADGTSIYRGSFLATEVRNGGSTLKPNWKPSAEDIRSWQPGNWRWRNTIPPGFQENFDRQFLTILKSEETLVDRRRTLETQTQILEQAKDALQRREDEIVGGSTLEKSPLIAPEFRDGLVPALEREEEERNKTLQRTDELRRKVRAIQADIERIQHENGELANRLPKSRDDQALSKKP